MKIKITAEVNVIHHYDLMRVTLEFPDEASPEEVEAGIRARMEQLCLDPEEVSGAIESRYSYAEGSVTMDLGEEGDLSDIECGRLEEMHFETGDDEART